MAIESIVIEKTADAATNIETLKVNGPVTLATWFEFQNALREAAGPKTVIDLSGVPYIDSAGLERSSTSTPARNGITEDTHWQACRPPY